MKRFLIVLMTFSLFSGYLPGQKPIDTLYLKNGSIVYGKLLKSHENRFSIKTPDGALFNFNIDEVDRFVSKEAFKTENKKSSVWRFMILSGLNIGSGIETHRRLWSVNPMLCYTKHPHRTISIGSGVEQFEGIYVPLFIDFSADFLKKDVTPFLYMKTGILFPLSGDEDYWNYSRNVRNGGIFGSGLGFSWPMSRIESFVRIGYRYAHTSIITKNIYVSPNTEEKEIDNFHRMEMTWGFTF